MKKHTGDFRDERFEISDGLITCLGDPEKYFAHDPLAILRALELSSQLGCPIEENTASAALKLRKSLPETSAEGIRDGLDRLICGKNVVDVMLRYRDIIGELIPELTLCFDFDQHSKYHKYDVYEHTVRAVDAVPAEDVLLRRVMLLHDLGKPVTFRLDEKGVGHFKTHAKVGAEIAGKVLKRLGYSSDTIDKMCELIHWHSVDMFTEEEARQVLSELGAEKFVRLMEVKIADNKAKNDFVLEENKWFEQCRRSCLIWAGESAE